MTPSAGPLPIGERTCRKCGETKQELPALWPHKPDTRNNRLYLPHGMVCVACEKIRKAEYERRRDGIAKGVARTIGSDSDKPTDKKALKDASRLDAAKALKSGSIAINEIAASVLARLMEYAEDTDHERHVDALMWFADRIAPRKLYEAIGGEAAGIGALSDKRPVFQINILPASPGAPGGNVGEGQLTDTTEYEVLALPAPTPGTPAAPADPTE